MKCKHCNKIFNNLGGLSAHVKSCGRISSIKQSIINAYKTCGITDVSKQFSIGKNTTLSILKDAGVHIRTKKESLELSHQLYPEKFKHTEDTKSNLRNKRISWMKLNPDKTAWRTRNTPSYPEKLFINMCNELDLYSTYDIVREYAIFPYFIDFAFINAKVAIEIDGSQHWLNSDRISSDIAKDMLLYSKGWRIMRIPSFKIQNSYDIVKNDIIKFLIDVTCLEKKYSNDIIEYEVIKSGKRSVKYIKKAIDKANKKAIKLITSTTRKHEFDQVYPQTGWSVYLAIKWNMTPQSVGRYCRKNFCIGVEHSRITKENIINCLSNKMTLHEIGKKYSINDSTVSDYCRKYGIKIPKAVIKVDWESIDLDELLKTKSGAQIARELKVTPSAVYRRLKVKVTH